MMRLSYSSLLTRERGPIILLLLLSLLFVTSFASLVFDYRTSQCNNASSYTVGGTYSDNLDVVLNYLIQNGSRSGSNASSYGQSSDKVYGFIQCYGNISAQDCSSCSKSARSQLQAYCLGDVGGKVWMVYCYMRYDNFNFVSKLDTEVKLLTYSWISNGTDVFQSVKFDLLSNLSKTASNPASGGFALGSAIYLAPSTVYGMAQCWRDISMDDCSTCLVAAIKALHSASRGAHAMLGSCTVRYEVFPFYEPMLSSSSPLPSSSPEKSPPPKSSRAADAPANGTLPLSKPKKKSSKTLPIILGTLGGVIFVTVLCVFAIRRELKSTSSREPVTAVTHNKERHGYSPETWLLSEERIFLFSLETLIEATQNFHPHNKLGEGGFGPVYKGTTQDGKHIAVKKLSAKSSQGENEFMNEVNLVASIQHRNLVKLLGCCVKGDERMLVYEYLPNKSLDNYLFDAEKRKHLDWEKRHNIIIGIARGLLYLHEDSQLRIVHRDVKANNILLDHKLNPKIADFGLARLFPEDTTHVHTKVAGTYGYMAPEYAMSGQLSVKADIYSFGVLLLEIVSGRKNTENDLPQEMQSLLEWAWRLYKRGDVLKMVDSMVVQHCPQEQAKRFIHIGLLCGQSDASLRPAMSNVLTMISSNLVTLPDPAKPAFVSSSQRLESQVQQHTKEVFSETSETATSSSSGFPSVNDTSYSELNAR